MTNESPMAIEFFCSSCGQKYKVAKIGDRRAVPAIRKLLSHEREIIRNVAKGALLRTFK
ncbi:MAG: hypothetical protein ACYTHM_02450 [Planctomycetota bacterium]